MSDIRWDKLLPFAIRNLGLRPHEFWALTPVEFMLMAGVDAGAEMSMTRAGLDALMGIYPDDLQERQD